MPATLRIQVVQRGVAAIENRIVDGELTRRMQTVLIEAKKLAPKSDGVHSYTDGIPWRTAGGRFANSLTIGTTIQNGKRVIRIFSNGVTNKRGQPYSIFLLRGTRPHIIMAKNPAQQPLFYRWIRRGTFMITDENNHYGTRPNKDWAIEALRIGLTHS